MATVYLDNAATTAVLPQAAQAALAVMTENYGNPSSLHEVGRAARELLEQSRAAVAGALGCAPACVTFTSGGTESINTALVGAAMKNRYRGRHIVSTAIEHDAVLKTLNDLKTRGFEVTLVPPERDGSVDLDKVLAALREDTVLLSMQGVNNETGALLPYQQAAEAYKKRVPEGTFHLDGVQNFLKRPMPLKNVDLASVSAHKIGGMKGCGALYMRPGLRLRPLLFGGGQESAMRSGTEGMPQIAAFAAAVAVRGPAMAQNGAHMAELKHALIERAREMGAAINTPALSADHIVNLSLCKGRSEVYIRALSDEGVCVSGGSACARGKKSHVLEAMHLPKRNIDAALRVSFCPENTLGDVERFCEALARAARLFV